MDDRPRQGIAWTKILGWGLSLAAGWFVARWLLQVDPQVWTYLHQTDPGLLLASLVIFQAWFVLRFLGWEMISQRYGLEDARRSNLKMWTISELMRYVPGNIWSFAARYRGARSRGTTAGGAVAALALEAIFLMSGAALVAAFFWRGGLWPLWIVGAVVIIFLIPFVMKSLARWRKWDNLPGLRWMDAVRLLALYAVVWVIYGTAQAMMVRSIPGLTVPSFTTLIGVNVLAWLLGYISILTPMGLGVREVAFVKLLHTTTASVASLLAVVTRVWLIIAEVVFLGLVMLFRQKK